MFTIAAILFWSHVAPAETSINRTILTSISMNEALVERHSPAGHQFLRCRLSNGLASERCAAVGPTLSDAARATLENTLATELGKVAREYESRADSHFFRPRNVFASTTAGLFWVYLLKRMGVRAVLPVSDVAAAAGLAAVSMTVNNLVERGAAPRYRALTDGTDRVREMHVLELDQPTVLEHTGLSPRTSADVYRGFVVALRRAAKRAHRAS